MLAQTGRRTAATAVAVLAGVVMAAGAVSPAAAKPKPAPSTTTTVDPIGAKAAQAVTLAQQIQENSDRLGLLAEQFDAAQQALDQANQAVAAGQAALDQALAAEHKARDAVATVAVASYVDFDQDNPLAAAAKRGEDPARAQAYVHVVSGRDQRLLDGLSLARAERANVVAALRATQAKAQQAQQELAASAAAAQVAEQQLEASLGQVQGDLVKLVGEDDAATIARNQAAAPSNPMLQFTPPFPLPPPSSKAPLAVQTAQEQLAKPYQWGATGAASFDCSGLMYWSWAHAGIGLPRTAANQFAALVHVPLSALAPGDLVFFGRSPDTIHHVGMYVGGGQMIDAPHSNATVRYDSIYWNDLFGFGRVFDGRR
jgi:cell wall-associated NlpC family hydrolase